MNKSDQLTLSVISSTINAYETRVQHLESARLQDMRTISALIRRAERLEEELNRLQSSLATSNYNFEQHQTWCIAQHERTTKVLNDV